MGAFIVAGIVFAITLVVTFFMGFAASMSDSPRAAEGIPVKATLFTGLIISALIAASHWMPHLGW